MIKSLVIMIKKLGDQSSSIDTELEREDRITVASAALDVSTE